MHMKGPAYFLDWFGLMTFKEHEWCISNNCYNLKSNKPFFAVWTTWNITSRNAVCIMDNLVFKLDKYLNRLQENQTINAACVEVDQGVVKV